MRDGVGKRRASTGVDEEKLQEEEELEEGESDVRIWESSIVIGKTQEHKRA